MSGVDASVVMSDACEVVWKVCEATGDVQTMYEAIGRLDQTQQTIIQMLNRVEGTTNEHRSDA